MIIDVKNDDCIPANDRVAQYGDGCFTTMCVAKGHVELLNLHVARLKHDCQRLRIDFADWSQLITHLTEYATRIQDGVLKALISRGHGGRGYGTLNLSKPVCYVSYAALPSHYSQQRSTGIRLSLSNIKLGAQPLFAGLKHCNRIEQVLIKLDLEASQSDDVIVCDYQDQVIETSVGNLFWRKNSTWMTPLLNSCGVSGVMRNHVVSMMKVNDINVLESNFNLDALVDCDEMFVCNSLMKIVPVREIVLENQCVELKTNNRTQLSWLTENLNEVIQSE